MKTFEIAVSRDNYTKATLALCQLALGDTSGSRTAAQMLLSAYNGKNWQLDITDLCNLDPTNFQHAMVFITCRAKLYTEPHTLLKNGDELFGRLHNHWYQLHIDNRWKTLCYECYGSREVYIDPDDENNENTKTCQVCNGLGLIPQVNEFRPTD